MHKLGTGQGDLQQPVRYPNFWSVEPTTGPDRLVIAPAGDQVDVMRALCEEWPGDYFLLYVLLVPRLGAREPGRYQSPAPLSFERISEFCDRFRAFLQTDGRHHFWIGSSMESGLLVYDHHDVIYAYGDLDHYVDVLDARGFIEGEVSFPFPHAHHFHPENDPEEEALIGYWQWKHFPLQEGDED